MVIDQRTTDGGIDVSFNNPPEISFIYTTGENRGTNATSTPILFFVAQKPYKLVHLQAAPRVIASGTLKVDILVNGVSVLTTKATATVAYTPIAATFPTNTIIEAEDTVLVQTTSDSDTVTDVFYQLILRPLLGAERLSNL